MKHSKVLILKMAVELLTVDHHISLHSAGQFKRLFKQTMSVHCPIKQHYFILAN